MLCPMAKVHTHIDEELSAFIAAQPVFFVATAPSGAEGHVNLSPKGYTDTFTLLDEHTAAYLDLTGSGVETIAHLRDNGRITLMFCAFEGPPNIVRLQGRGRVVLADDPDFAAWRAHFGPRAGVRAVVVVDVTRISSSCGFAVPFMQLQGERGQLDQFWQQKDDDAIADYQVAHNRTSIDGLTAID